MSQAVRMLDAFAAVGANVVDVTITDFQGEILSYRPAHTIDNFKRTADQLVTRAKNELKNVIIRPRSETTLIQLDDVDEAKVAIVQPFSFLSFETSPGNFQAWLALSHSEEDFPRRVRKQIGADLGASGATRLAGSKNYKPRHSPHWPTVRITSIAEGHFTTSQALIDAGLVAPQEEHLPLPIRPVRSPGRFPDYQRCLTNAPLAHGTDHPDISRADFLFCRIAYKWGHSVEAIVEELLARSPKARNSRITYSQTTAEKAARSVDQEIKPPTPRP